MFNNSWFQFFLLVQLSMFLFISCVFLTSLSVMIEFVIFEDRQAILDRVKEDVLDLELVLVVRVALAQVPELLRLVETPFQVFRRNEIFCDLDAIVNVANLKKRIHNFVKSISFMGWGPKPPKYLM